jgi:hypothetical protein
LGRSRHTPASHRKLALAIFGVAKDRGHLIGEDSGEQVAGAIVPSAEQVTDRRFTFGQ